MIFAQITGGLCVITPFMFVIRTSSFSFLKVVLDVADLGQPL